MTDHLSFNIEMKKADFSESLKKITYKTNTAFITLIPDHGIHTRFEYRGTVNKSDFTIKRRSHFFDFNIFHFIIKGNISEEDTTTFIKTEFTPFISHFLAAILALLLFLIISIAEIVNNNNYFIIGFPCIIAVSKYFILKRNIKRDNMILKEK
ncbi:hypothetical protein SD427_13740 [Chryseobacterium sp. JJR-5R]|uniref:hypothetical protein n=1 Tax=Chryseobacterium sp. JJR-5R TaxID=3093923 RepID=UPI002A76428B|nr:hypothetical protein [Chryseobacterium sp. JJR-5R]WPO81826.1 hypothetical protein SD427_13740 [Chryseobacterium sp. JJR-5R]